MLIYKKYIFGNILLPFAILTVVLTILVWIVQILRMMYLLDKGIEFKYFFKLIILLIPSLLFIILPLIMVLAVIYAYNSLQDKRQLAIFRNSGLSNYDLAKPALLIATSITIIAYYISIYLMPLSYNRMKQQLSYFRENHVSNIINIKTFNQISKYSNIYVDHKNSDGSLGGIIFFDNKIPANKTVLFAKNGKIIISNHHKTELELTNGVRHSYDKFGNLTKLYFDHLIIAIANKNTQRSIREKNSVELYINELLYPNSNLSKQKQHHLIADGHVRIIWPLFNFAFVLFALSIFLNQPYNKNSSVKKFVLTFIPVLIITYLHFTLHKIAYKNLNYIYLCYANILLCMILGIWQNTRHKL